jgi:hypothetical protein
MSPIQIRITVRESYGNIRCYPVDSELGISPAELLARIAGTKTLSARVLGMAEQMGMEVIPEHDDGRLNWRNAV